MATVSIVVPVYNCEQYLRECLDSILAQSFRDIEIILVDDGSTDGSSEICDYYSTLDSRISVIHKKNEGVSVARNTGVNNAKGAYVSFVDSDDMIHPCFIETLIKPVIESNVKIVSCEVYKSEKTGWTTALNSSFKTYEATEEAMLELVEIASPSWIVTGKIIDIEIPRKIPFEPGKVFEDNAVMMQWIFGAGAIAVSDMPLYYYRTNENSLTKSDLGIHETDFLWALSELIRFFKKTKYNKMRERIGKAYFNAALSVFQRIKTSNKLNNKTGYWKWHISFFLLKNIRYCGLNRNKVYSYFELFWPWTIRVFHFFKSKGKTK